MSSKGLSKLDIIRGRGAFSEIISEGRCIQETHLRGYFYAVGTKCNRGPHLRVGFAVSRQLRSAVVRNRIRRLMREAYRRRIRITTGLMSGNEQNICLVLMYMGNESTDVKKLTSKDLEKDVQRILEAVSRSK